MDDFSTRAEAAGVRPRGSPGRAGTGMSRASVVLLALVHALLVAHLLFVPYEYVPLSLGEMLRRASQAKWMELGSDQNVALVSRALMFLPLGLLLAAAFAPRPRGAAAFLAGLAAFVLGTTWAAAVNVAQLLFPSRTVSLNNLAAEAAGVLVGALLWCALGSHASVWWRRLSAGGFVSVRAALGAYVVLYLAMSLLPFDFVTNARELAEKFDSGLYALWKIPGGCGAAPCSLKFLAALVIAIPCGWWYAVQRGTLRGIWVHAVPLALIVSVAIEVLHFFMVSGVSQGASLLVRVAGMLLGVASYAWRDRLAAIDLGRAGRPIVVALALPYLVAVAYVGGWSRSAFIGLARGSERIGEIVWMPFYYPYLNPYTDTMQSTLVHVALYAPVGAACWLWARRRDAIPLWVAPALAAVLAFIVESAKVFLEGRYPDYTDVVIAACSAWVVLASLRHASRSHQHQPVRPEAATVPGVMTSHGSATAGDLDRGSRARPTVPGSGDLGRSGRTFVGLAGRVAGALAACAALATVVGFPFGSWALGFGLAAYAALLVRFPLAYLVAIPALLPILDLAPWSGRFYWDEFDALIATTIATRLLMRLPERNLSVSWPAVTLATMLASVLLSALAGAWPPAPLDANAFSSYLGGYNAFRVAKGYAWGGVLLWLAARDMSAGRRTDRVLGVGLALALLVGVSSVLLERVLFLGAPEPSGAFRAAGFVSALHVGGAYLEALLVMLAPWGLAFAWRTGSLALRVLASIIVMLSGVAVLQTVSRAAFVAWIASVTVFAWTMWRRSAAVSAASGTSSHRALVGIAILAIVVALGLATQSSFLMARLSLSHADLAFRAAHWKESLELLLRQPSRLLLGAGLGSFPREFYVAHAASYELPAYRIEWPAGADPGRLVLTGGGGMFIDQRVTPAVGGGELRFSGLIRSAQGSASLGVALCVKSLLNSLGCRETGVSASKTWQTFDVALEVPPIEGLGALRPPLSLSLQNGKFGSRIEVAQLSLREGDRELLRNGAFGQGLDFWFITSDRHLAWRVLNTPLQVVFEQGLIGVLAWSLLLAAALRRPRHGATTPAVSSAVVASIAGILLVGCFDSLLDWPRLVVLLALVIGMVILGGKAPQPGAGPPA